MIDLTTIAISSLIALGIALFFRFFMRPYIELVYKDNRDSIINGMLREIYRTDTCMAEVYSILQNQNNFVPDHAQIFTFTQREVNMIRFQYSIVHRISSDLSNFTDHRMHIRDDEYLALSNYAHFSDQFLEWLLHQPFGEYMPEFLESRKGFARDIIKFFNKHLSFEFKRDWNAVI